MRRLSFLPALITATLCAIPASIFADENHSTWPGEEKQIAIDACRMAFVKSAYQDYLSRQGLSAEEIADIPFESTPADQQVLVLEQLEPVLQVCDCVFDILAAEVPWVEFLKDSLGDQQQLMKKQNEIAESGRCPQASGPPSSPSDSNDAPSSSIQD